MASPGTVLTVHPIYGWGWSDSRSANPIVETPVEFNVAAEIGPGGEATGTVVSDGHPYSGARITLTKRHTEWDGYVNVEVSKEGPDGFGATGYAQIPLESFPE